MLSGLWRGVTGLSQARLPPAVEDLLKQEPPGAGWLKPEFEPGLVSVIIPVHNGGEFIGETLASIIAQTYDKIEVVVADDGSTDNTPELLAQWRERFRSERGWDLRVLRQPSRGQNSARNLGAANSRGEYLNFFDCDDLMAADRLAAMVGAIRAGGLDMVHGPWVRFYRERSGLFVAAQERFDSEGLDPLLAYLTGCRLVIWACLLRRSFADRIGRFDERLKGGNVDSEYNYRMFRLGPMADHCPAGPVFYRRHPKSVTFHLSPRAFANVVYWLTMLERSLEQGAPSAAYRKGLARMFRRCAVNAYRDGAGDIGDYCAGRADLHAPDFVPPRRRLRRMAFRLGGLRLTLLVQGWLERLRRWRWRAARRLGLDPKLEPVVRVAELPLRGAGT